MDLVIPVTVSAVISVIFGYITGYNSAKGSENSTQIDAPFEKWSRKKRLYVASGLRRQAHAIDKHFPDDKKPEMQNDMKRLADWLEQRE